MGWLKTNRKITNKFFLFLPQSNSPGALTICQVTIGQMTIGQMTIGQMTIGQMTIGQMTIGQMTIGQILDRWVSSKVI